MTGFLAVGRLLGLVNLFSAALIVGDGLLFGGVHSRGQDWAGHLALAGVIHLMIEKTKGR